MVSQELSGMAAKDVYHHFVEDIDQTRPPPPSALRHDRPAALYAAFPMLGQMTQQHPGEDEDGIDYLTRLRGSATPEEALSFAAFALHPKMAIWWAYECLRVAGEKLSLSDRALMEAVAEWTTHPADAIRFDVMRAALYAPVRTPAVFLGLAVGWSGGGIAPNDTAPIPSYRTPRAINTAVLSCLSRAELADRPKRLARFIDKAAPLFRCR